MRRGRWILVAGAFLGVAALSGLATRGGHADQQGALQVDGRERTYTFHVGSGYDGTHAVPLVLALHGRLGQGSGQERLSHFDKLSDEHGFIVVYPDGLDRSWADGRGAVPSDRKGVDDVKFLSNLIGKFEAGYKIDPSRVYAMGMSNGGFMTARLACQMSNRIAGVAIVAASLSDAVAESCKPAVPISVLILQGTDDPLVAFTGGSLGRNGDRGVILSHAATVEKFVALDRCTTAPAKEHIPDEAGDGTTIDVATYSGCAAGTEVRSYVVNGGGHAWPSGMKYLPATLIGKTSRNLDASEAIWEFFSRHALSAATKQ
ncbi:MAG TPA: PHB depolymerase family esterase [Candidatus Saccharimonadales bacterium]|nr:PHB depolymerase family esterase [Candidatus Saccharimonadales bacterium]